MKIAIMGFGVVGGGVGQIADKHKILFVVDASQTAGVLPIDVQEMKIDILCFTGHKALLGPQGTGGLYIRPDIELRPLREGGTGSSSESMLQPKEQPERFESGTVNLPGIAGLGEGVEYVSANLSAIMSHERELAQALYEGLSAINGIKIYSPSEEAARAGKRCGTDQRCHHHIHSGSGGGESGGGFSAGG